MDTHLLFEEVMSHSPVIRRTIEGFGELTLKEYVDHLTEKVPDIQTDRLNSFLSVLEEQITLRLGAEMARKVCEDVEHLPAVLTMHHFGMDSLSQSIHSQLFFSARSVGDRKPYTIPILAFGCVSMSNMTFPAGLLLYQLGKDRPEKWPQALRIFPARFDRSCVYSMPSFDQDMCERAKKQLRKRTVEQALPGDYTDLACGLIDEVFASNIHAANLTYEEQATAVNYELWKKVQSDIPLVFLQAERIVVELLQQDVRNESSLFGCLLADPDKTATLLAILEEDGLAKTHFFWGIDGKGRTFSLNYRDGKLQGYDLKNNLYTCSFTPEAILSALRQGELVPSIFTTFLVISFDRGLTCIGGFYQAEYLPRMYRAASNVFDGDFIHPVPADLYLSGMQGIVDRDGRYPLGFLELIHRGGVNTAIVDRLMALTVKQAHLLSLPEIASEFFPDRYDPLSVMSQISGSEKAILM